MVCVLDRQICYPTTVMMVAPKICVFSISGRGRVCTGRIERGVIKVGEEVETWRCPIPNVVPGAISAARQRSPYC
jgi:translation elongation factor EF-Tu-like GTPase